MWVFFAESLPQILYALAYIHYASHRKWFIFTRRRKRGRESFRVATQKPTLNKTNAHIEGAFKSPL